MECLHNSLVRAERPLPDDLPDRLDALARRWFADEEIAALYLFGSRARGTAALTSDVDLAVVLRGDLNASARWRKRLALSHDASVELGTDAVGLVVLEETPAVLGHRVLRDGRLLGERDPRRRVEVAEAVLRRYCDEAWLRAELDRALAARVREGRFAR